MPKAKLLSAAEDRQPPELEQPKLTKSLSFINNQPTELSAMCPQKHRGLLWVWPESTPEAKLLSAAEDRQPPELEHVDSPWRSAWYIREVPLRCAKLDEFAHCLPESLK